MWSTTTNSWRKEKRENHKKLKLEKKNEIMILIEEVSTTHVDDWSGRRGKKSQEKSLYEIVSFEIFN